MADIFVSYARADRARVAPLVAALEAQGWSVWWDPEIVPGQEFDKLIAKELDGAGAVVVVWTPTAVESRWVRGEAREAADRGVLAPVRFDNARLPLDVRALHTIDLDGWNGDPDSAEFRRLCHAIGGFLGGEPAKPPNAPPAPRSRRRTLRGRWLAASAAVLALVAIAYLAVFPGSPFRRPPLGKATTIAVLPFANLSGDREQEYFSDGLSEELTNQLAQIDDLRVTGRTSTLAFKGRNEDVRVIGKKLGVAYLLVGSVQRSGKRLRITSQLVNVANGYSLWSDRYDREAADVFAIQDDIAGAVAGKLRVQFGAGSKDSDYGGTKSFEAYDHFLKAGRVWASVARAELPAHVDHLRQAVALDPNYAAAWANLSALLSYTMSVLPPEQRKAMEAERERATRRALALAPELPAAHVAEGWLRADQRDWSAADAAFMKAVQRGPGHDPAAESIVGGFLTVTGRVQQGLVFREQARKSDPLSLTYAGLVASSYVAQRRWSDFDAEYTRSLELQGDRGSFETLRLGYLLAKPGPAAEIQAQLRKMSAAPNASQTIRKLAAEGISSPLLERLIDDRAGAYDVALAAGSRGENELALRALRVFSQTGGSSRFQGFWHPALSGVRKTAGFRDLMRELGLAQFWRASGKWPDMCRSAGPDDFACE